jgi:phosphate-selective porin OprO and OprP
MCEDPQHIDFSKPNVRSHHSVEALARLEQLDVKYDGASRLGSVPNPRTPNGDIRVNAFTLGLTYWGTRRIRASVNYTYYIFPQSEPVSASTAGGPAQTSEQRAIAPAQNLAKGVMDNTRNNGHTLNELAVRIGVGF